MEWNILLLEKNIFSYEKRMRKLGLKKGDSPGETDVNNKQNLLSQYEDLASNAEYVEKI